MVAKNKSKPPLPIENKAVAYLRVSTERQKESGFSLIKQEETARDYAKQNGLDITKVFTEVKSASTINKNSSDKDLESSLRNRPVLLEILHLAVQNKFQNIIIFSRDRLARDLGMFIALNIEFKNLNIKVHYSRPGEITESTDSKIYKFLDLILASVAELESNVLSTRVKGGNRICIKNNYWAGGKAPFGYILQRDKNYFTSKKSKHSRLKASLFEKSIVQEVFDLYIRGYSYKDISSKMNVDHKYISWTKSKIETIIINETYTGRIAWNRRSGKRNAGKKLTPEYSTYDKNTKIIDSDLYDKVKQLRIRKSNLKDSRYYTTPFLLKNKLICGTCGATLIPKNYGKNKTNVYRCPTVVNKKSDLILEQADIEATVIEKLREILANNNTDELWSYYKIEINKRKDQYNKVKKGLNENIKEVTKLHNNILHLRNKKDISDDLVERLNFQDDILNKTKNNFLEEIAKKGAKLKEITSLKKIQYDEALNHFKSFFLAQDNYSSRVLIDILIEHIDVRKAADDKISLNILINPLQGIITPPKEKAII